MPEDHVDRLEKAIKKYGLILTAVTGSIVLGTNFFNCSTTWQSMKDEIGSLKKEQTQTQTSVGQLKQESVQHGKDIVEIRTLVQGLPVRVETIREAPSRSKGSQLTDREKQLEQFYNEK